MTSWFSRLFSRGSGPTPEARAAQVSKALRSRVVKDQSLWDQFQRIGGGLTPVQVSEIIREADAGYPARFVDLINEARQKDCHLQSVLFTRESAVVRLKWELHVEGSTKKKPKGARQTKLVEQALRGNPALPALIAHLAGADYYGYAVSEIDWGVDARSRMVPIGFTNLSARRFGFRNADGKLIWRDSTTNGVEVDLSAYPRKFIISQPRITGDVPAREGLGRVLSWASLFRNWTVSDWLKLAELAWKPWRIGVYKKDADEKDIDHLEALVEGLVASGSGTHAETVDLQLKWPEGGAGGSGKAAHGELFDRMGAEMSKAVIGQTLTTEQGSRGSQSLGKVHNDVRNDILEFDAKHIAAVITRDLIRPLIELNFGPGAPVPEFRFITRDSADMKSFAEAVEKLAGPTVKMRIGAEWARDEMGIPEPEDDDELLGSLEVDVSDLDTPDPTNDPPEGEDDSDDSDAKEDDAEAA